MDHAHTSIVLFRGDPGRDKWEVKHAQNLIGAMYCTLHLFQDKVCSFNKHIDISKKKIDLFQPLLRFIQGFLFLRSIHHGCLSTRNIRAQWMDGWMDGRSLKLCLKTAEPEIHQKGSLSRSLFSGTIENSTNLEGEMMQRIIFQWVFSHKLSAAVEQMYRLNQINCDEVEQLLEWKWIAHASA